MSFRNMNTIEKKKIFMFFYLLRNISILFTQKCFGLTLYDYSSIPPLVFILCFHFRPKEIVDRRPKTPLVDTRSRSKTPTENYSDYYINKELKELDINKNQWDAGASSTIPGFMPSNYSDSMSYCGGYNVYQVNKRKESTSFEHEQPLPSNDMRYVNCFHRELLLNKRPRSNSYSEKKYVY